MVSCELDRSGGDGDCSRSPREVIVAAVGKENRLRYKGETRKLSLDVAAIHPRPVKMGNQDEEKALLLVGYWL